MLTALSAEQLQQRVPHAGDMCFIDQVLDLSGHALVALSKARVFNRHPLAVNGALSDFALVEIAAQAAALHISTLEQGGIKKGVPVFLAGVKKIRCYGEALSESDDILISARCLGVSEMGALYEFTALKGALTSDFVRQESNWQKHPRRVSGRFSLMAAA